MSLIREWADVICHGVFLYPGKHEMDSVAEGAFRALRSGERPKQYK